MSHSLGQSSNTLESQRCSLTASSGTRRQQKSPPLAVCHTSPRTMRTGARGLPRPHDWYSLSWANVRIRDPCLQL